MFLAVSGLRRTSISGGGDGQADLPNAPKISGTPDILNSSNVSSQRAKLTKQADNQAIWQAASQGKSALPTAFGQSASISPDGEDINQYNQKNQDGATKSDDMVTPKQGQQSEGQQSEGQQSVAQQEAQADAQAASLQAQITSADGSDDGQGEGLSGAMATEVKQLLTSWDPTTQQYTEATAQQTNATGNNNQTSGAQGLNLSGSNAKGAPSLLKAGSILFGVLQTGVNTDSPGPIMATVEVGPYKGAKLLGSLQPAGRYAKGVALKFTTMTLPQYNTSISINAYAIDPDTAHTALASNVDHHYLLRYGTLIASSFIGGLGEATALSNSTVVSGPLGGTTQNYQLPDNFGAQALYAAGEAGQKVGDEAGKLFNRPTTITINSGTGIGILYMQDVSAPKGGTSLASQSISSPAEQSETTSR